jgi:hypothetical protein
MYKSGAGTVGTSAVAINRVLRVLLKQVARKRITVMLLRVSISEVKGEELPIQQPCLDAANSGGRWQTGPLRLCPPELHLLRACAQRVAAVYRLPEPPAPAPGLTFFYVDRVVYIPAGGGVPSSNEAAWEGKVNRGTGSVAGLRRLELAILRTRKAGAR